MQDVETISLSAFEALANPIAADVRALFTAMQPDDGDTVAVLAGEGEGHALGARKSVIKKAAKRLGMPEPRFVAAEGRLWMAPGERTTPRIAPAFPDTRPVVPSTPVTNPRIGEACGSEGCTGTLRTVQGGGLRCRECGMRPADKRAS